MGVRRQGRDSTSEREIEATVVGAGASRSADELEATGSRTVFAGAAKAGEAGAGATNSEAACEFKPGDVLEGLGEVEAS